MELFSPNDKEIKKYDPEIDYIDDLKFWINNNDELVSKLLMPAIKKQKERNEENSEQLYIEPLKKCCDMYCKEFDLLDSKDEIFSNDKLLELARKISKEQSHFIKKGDYDHEAK